MREINGIPSVVEGTAYWAHILVPNTRFEPQKFELNLAVSDEVFQLFSDAGYYGCHAAGTKDFSPDAVVVFQKFAHSKDGTPNPSPRLVNGDNEDIDVALGNGSRVKVQWSHREYPMRGSGNMVLRAEPVAVQVINLIEYGETSNGSAATTLEF